MAVTSAGRLIGSRNSTLRRRLGLRRSSVNRLKRVPGTFRHIPVTPKNVHEVAFAKKLDATLTTGSGATFSNGDMKVDGRFLIEHKFRDKEVVVLPYSVFEKIRSQAERRGLIPVLGVTNSFKQDFMIMKVSDFHMMNRSIVPGMMQFHGLEPRKTIWIDAYHTAPNSVAFLNITCQGASELCMITLEDFRRISKTIPDK